MKASETSESNAPGFSDRPGLTISANGPSSYIVKCRIDNVDISDEEFADFYSAIDQAQGISDVYGQPVHLAFKATANSGWRLMKLEEILSAEP